MIKNSIQQCVFLTNCLTSNLFFDLPPISQWDIVAYYTESFIRTVEEAKTWFAAMLAKGPNRSCSWFVGSIHNQKNLHQMKIVIIKNSPPMGPY